MEVKEIWKYKEPHGIYAITIHENGNGILIIESKGIAYIDGCKEAFNFILNYAKKNNKKVDCLLDNSKLDTIDSSVKLLFLRFQEANHYINKAAIIGNNYILNSYGKIFQHTCRYEYPIRTFNNKTQALSWLGRNC